MTYIYFIHPSSRESRKRRKSHLLLAHAETWHWHVPRGINFSDDSCRSDSFGVSYTVGESSDECESRSGPKQIVELLDSSPARSPPKHFSSMCMLARRSSRETLRRIDSETAKSFTCTHTHKPEADGLPKAPPWNEELAAAVCPFSNARYHVHLIYMTYGSIHSSECEDIYMCIRKDIFPPFLRITYFKWKCMLSAYVYRTRPINPNRQWRMPRNINWLIYILEGDYMWLCLYIEKEYQIDFASQGLRFRAHIWIIQVSVRYIQK